MNDILTTSTPWYTNTPLLVGLVALIGTLLGAVIGAASNYLIARQNRLEDAKTEEQRSAKDVRQAARLIAVDLLVGAGFIKTVIEYRNWSVEPPKMTAWEKYAPTLAAALPAIEWGNVSLAEYRLEQASLAQAHNLGPHGSRAVDEKEMKRLKEKAKTINDGLMVLKKWIRDTGPDEEKLDD